MLATLFYHLNAFPIYDFRIINGKNCCKFFLNFSEPENYREINYNSRPLTSHMRLREIDPITIRSRVRDTTSCVFAPHSVGANSVRLRHGISRSCYSLKGTTSIPPTLEVSTSPWLGI